MDGMRTVDRALDILESFTGDNHRKQNLDDLVEATALPKATVHRMVKNLERRGYLSYDKENALYALGYRVLLLSSAYLNDLEFRSVALPYMKELRDKTNESVSLWLDQKDSRLCVERVQSREPLRQVISVGDVLPLDKGSSGKLLLAFRNTPADDALLPAGEAQAIRTRGYAISHAERCPGICSIAAPIRNAAGQVIAAISIAGPAFRFAEDKLDEYRDYVVQYSSLVSRDLGYFPKDEQKPC